MKNIKKTKIDRTVLLEAESLAELGTGGWTPKLKTIKARTKWFKKNLGMATEPAIKISKNIFSYRLIESNRNIIYNRMEGRIILTDATTGGLIKSLHNKVKLEFEDFVLVAKNLWFDFVMSN